MDISQLEPLIQECDNQINIKEKEKKYISASTMDEIIKRVKLAQTQAEIDELIDQRAYYVDVFRSEMIKTSLNCNCNCCNGNCCYQW